MEYTWVTEACIRWMRDRRTVLEASYLSPGCEDMYEEKKKELEEKEEEEWRPLRNNSSEGINDFLNFFVCFFTHVEKEVEVV